MTLTSMSIYYGKIDLSTLILTIIPRDTDYSLQETTLKVAQLSNGATGV